GAFLPHRFFVPFNFSAKDLGGRGEHTVLAFARLKPGATIEQARAQMDAVSTRLAQLDPYHNHHIRGAVDFLREDTSREVRTSILVLAGAVGLILLIACVNLANLLMVRAANHEREITIRLALGASRMRVIGSLLTSSLVLAGAGCVAGLFVGFWTRAA